MAKFSVLEQGNVYFFYKPKVQHTQAHELEDVQRFFMVLKPTDAARYILVIIGRKHLPKNEGESYLAIVDSIKEKLEDLLASLKAQHYETRTSGNRDALPARLLAEGKYIILTHDNHAHFIYQLQPSTMKGEAQEKFNLKEKGDYLINVKNPQKPSPPGVGLTSHEKASYPEFLLQQFDDYRFIPLSSSDFLHYEGSELLLIEKGSAKLSDQEPEIQDCLDHIPEEDISKQLEAIMGSESVEPLFEGHMK